MRAVGMLVEGIHVVEMLVERIHREVGMREVGRNACGRDPCLW